MRRRILLPNQSKIVVTYDELKQTLLAAGESEGVDSVGSYVTNSGNKTSYYVPIIKDFKRGVQYECYVKSNASSRINLGYRMIKTSGSDITSAQMIKNGTYLIPDSTFADSYSLYSICGAWYTSSFRIYDFYIKEI